MLPDDHKGVVVQVVDGWLRLSVPSGKKKCGEGGEMARWQDDKMGNSGILTIFLRLIS